MGSLPPALRRKTTRSPSADTVMSRGAPNVNRWVRWHAGAGTCRWRGRSTPRSLSCHSRQTTTTERIAAASASEALDRIEDEANTPSSESTEVNTVAVRLAACPHRPLVDDGHAAGHHAVGLDRRTCRSDRENTSGCVTARTASGSWIAPPVSAPSSCTSAYVAEKNTSRSASTVASRPAAGTNGLGPFGRREELMRDVESGHRERRAAIRTRSAPPRDRPRC